METYFMIKPEIVSASEQKIGEILAHMVQGGLRIEDLQLRRLERPLVEEFYAEHRERPFFPDLVAYITSGPVVAVRLSGGDDAVPRVRELIGATNPAEAAAGTVRALYGESLQHNAVHASANPDDAARELALIFGA